MTSSFFFERLAKVTRYATPATTVPFYNISALCKRNKKIGYINYQKAQRAACKGSKSRMRVASCSLTPLFYTYSLQLSSFQISTLQQTQFDHSD